MYLHMHECIVMYMNVSQVCAIMYYAVTHTFILKVSVLCQYQLDTMVLHVHNA